MANVSTITHWSVSIPPTWWDWCTGTSGGAIHIWIHIRGGSHPQHLHNVHDNYPLTPESLEIGSDMYSPAQHAAFPQTAPQRKLTPNLRDKFRYVVHYLSQSTWLKTYIEFNTHQRSLAGSSFLKDFFKLMNNSVFGKTQENLRSVDMWNWLQMLVSYANRLPNRISIEATPLLTVWLLYSALWQLLHWINPYMWAFPCSTCQSCTCITFTTITCV